MRNGESLWQEYLNSEKLRAKTPNDLKALRSIGLQGKSFIYGFSRFPRLSVVEELGAN